MFVLLELVDVGLFGDEKLLGGPLYDQYNTELVVRLDELHFLVSLGVAILH